jgi:ADP-heptose:LPS heptosyltransferase
MMLYSARSVLAIDVSPFGRSLKLLPAMKLVREAYPNAFIAAAASTGICELLINAGLVTETIDLGVIKPEGGASLKRIIRLLRSARRFNFDLILDFAPRPETQFLSRVVLRARTIAPSRLPLVLEFLTGGAFRRRSDGPGGYESVLRKLGLEAGEGRIAITPMPEENTRFEELLSRNGFRGGEPVVVLYTAGGANAWPVPSFAETAHRLANNFNARVLAADEPSGQSFTSALEALLPKTAIVLAEPRALGLMAAVARASVLITDEPNLAAAASEMGTPVVDLAEPFLRADRRGPPGLKLASPTTDEVYDAACEILQESRSPSLFRQ